jgi:hypothetical protein
MAYDEARLVEALKNADAAGDFEAATKIAQIIQQNRAQPAADPRQAAAQAAMAQFPVGYREGAMRELASEQGPIDSLLIGAGRGFYNIGRGLGLVEPAGEVEKQAYAALQEQRPIATTIGEVVGESAPFVIPGAGAGKIAALAPRAAAMAGLGAAQGTISARGRGEDLNTQMASGAIGGAVAGGLELALPYIGRAAGSVVRRVTGREPAGQLIDSAGRPTAELQDALAKAGISYDELAESAMRELTQAAPGTDPAQAARAALFASENIPATRGAITQDFAQQATEARLAESASDIAASPFRETIKGQSEAIKGRLDDLIQNLGVPERTGESLKEALSGRKSLLKAEKSALYRKAAEQAENVGVLPILPDNIAGAIPDDQAVRRISRLVPGQAGALDDLLIEFGVKKAPEGFTGQVTPLSLGNLEDFRSAINMIERSDNTGTIKVLSGPVKSALDAEADLMADAVEQAGISGAADLIGTLKQARGVVREVKTEFSPQALAGRLIDTQRDGVTEKIEASKVIPTLFSKATPVEQLKKTLGNLSKGGEKGKQAIGDLQAATIMSLMDKAYGATGRKIGETPIFGPAAFQKALKDIGEDKINVLFSGNKEALQRLKNIEGIAKLIQPPNAAVPKGSASVNTDLFKRFVASKVPFGETFMDVINTAKMAGDTGRDVQQALSARPELIKMAQSINRDYPALASAMGIAVIGQAMQDEEPEPLMINRGQ